jgi:esterase/lipase superfamily enzyme
MAHFILSFRDKPVGGAVTNGVLTAGRPEDFLDMTRITFITHGYNVKEADGRSRLGQLAQRLSKLSGSAVISVLWPGDNWLRGLAYPFKGKAADDTARGLARFIVQHKLHEKELNFISHSLGGRVVMETIKVLPRRVPINQVCLLAAAVDDTCLHLRAQYADELSRIRRVAVLASKRDKVLAGAYPLGDLTHFFQDFSNRPGLALGWHGPRPQSTEKIYHVQIDDLDPNPKADHGHYLPDETASEFVQKKQAAAARFADEVITGQDKPRYALRP